MNPSRKQTTEGYTLAVSFNITVPMALYKPNGDEACRASVAVTGTYYSEETPQGPLADSDYDALGIKSHFDYEIVSVVSDEVTDIKKEWTDNVEFDTDLYTLVSEELWKMFEDTGEPYFIPTEDDPIY